MRRADRRPDLAQADGGAGMKEEFLPTLGNMIKGCDAIFKDTPKSLYPLYAKHFNGTLTEEVIFSGDSFGEAAEKYCREAGWRES